jgi:hypothetical protein
LVLASPSFSQLILDLSLAIVLLKEASSKDCILSLFLSQFLAGESSLWSWAISNLCRSSFASSNCEATSHFLSTPALQPFRSRFKLSIQGHKGAMQTTHRVPRRLNSIKKPINFWLECFKVESFFPKGIIMESQE